MPEDKQFRLIALLLAEYAERLTSEPDEMTLPAWLDAADVQALARDGWQIDQHGLPTKAQVAEWCRHWITEQLA